MPNWKELKYHDPDEVESPEDVDIPQIVHHMQARAEIDLLIQEGCLTTEEGSEALEMWRDGGTARSGLMNAISTLQNAEVIGQDEAEDLRARVEA
jgi:hypothetical protein